MLLNKLQQQIVIGRVCPYCKQPSIHMNSSAIYGKDYGMIYRCNPCDAHVGTHKKRPHEALGRLANAELRHHKQLAHAAFDPIWKQKHMTRHEAYKWLSKQLGLPKGFTHIGMFSVETCRKVVTLSNDYLKQI